MVRESEIRDGELTVDMPPARDAGLVFIGRIRTPWTSRLENPRHVLAALAGAAQSDRHLDRQASRDRGQCDPGAWIGLPRRDAAARSETRSLRVHAAGVATGRRFRDGVIGL